MDTQYVIGERVRVVDKNLDDYGATGVVIALNDGGHYYVSLDDDPTPAEQHPFAAAQLAPEQDP